MKYNTVRYTVVKKTTLRTVHTVSMHSRQPYFYRVFTVLQVNLLPYYSHVIKSRMNCWTESDCFFFYTSGFFIVLGILLVAVYPFTCCFVLVFLIADSLERLRSSNGRKHTQTTAKARTAVTSSASNEVVCFGEE